MDFSLRKNSARVDESFVGAGGQNPVFVQKRDSFLTFFKSTSKCSPSTELATERIKTHRTIILNIFMKVLSRHLTFPVSTQMEMLKVMF